MAIEGPLRELGIHDVFQLLDLSRKTGMLCVSSKLREDEGVVHFDGGRVVHASIRSKSVPIELVLLEAGRITQADLDHAHTAGDDGEKEGGRTIVDSLVRVGAITQRDLERQLRLQIESVVFELMSWREGFFSFEERSRDDLPHDTRIAVSTESLLMEGARRIDEWSRIADVVPNLDVVPELAPVADDRGGDDGGPTLDLLPHEWQVLTMIDGDRDLRAIAALLGRDEFETAKIAYGLTTTGVIAIRRPAEPLVMHAAVATLEPPPTGVAAQVSAARAAVEQLLRRAPTGVVAPEARDALDALARLERVLAVNAHG
jgi:Domain of unknown function (DUF4388)